MCAFWQGWLLFYILYGRKLKLQQLASYIGRDRYRVIFALFAMGAFSQVIQAILMRQLLVVFYGNEISFGAFYGCWLMWIGIGSLLIARLFKADAVPKQAFFWSLQALPAMTAIQMIMVYAVRFFVSSSVAEFISLGDLLVATLVITLPTGLILGMAFPLGCQMLADMNASGEIRDGHAAHAAQSTHATYSKDYHQQLSMTTPNSVNSVVGEITQLYIIEAFGAFVGGLGFTFLLIEYLDTWSIIGLIFVLMAIAGYRLSFFGAPKKSALTLGGLGVLILITPAGSWLQTAFENLRFNTLHPGLHLENVVTTRYGHVAIASLGQQRSIIHNGRITESFPQQKEVAQEAAFFYSQTPTAERVLLFGGLAGELMAALLQYPIAAIDVVFPDQQAFDMVYPHLPPTSIAALTDQRVHIHFIDGRRFVNQLPDKAVYDLVLVLSQDPSSAHQNRYFTKEFYTRTASVMNHGGVFCTHVDSASNYLGRDVSSYSGAAAATLKSVFSEVVVAPGDTHTFCASAVSGQVSVDPKVLIQRYEDIPLKNRDFPASAFNSILSAERVDFVKRKLAQEEGEINTDSQPVSYYLNMVLWGKFTASNFVTFLNHLRRMGHWPYWVPLLVFVVLLLVRNKLAGLDKACQYRTGATFALAVLGFIAMAMQLQLIFSYQAHVGFAFSRIAFLNGMFMTGLALGAAIIGKMLARMPRPGMLLIGLLILVACACALLPMVLAALPFYDSRLLEVIFFSMVTVTGVLVGSGFPIAVRLTHKYHTVANTSGLIEAADHFGGAAGGLLTGAFFVPILGINGTSYLLAWVTILASIPLVFAEFAVAHKIAAPPRGQPSFRFVRTSWVLAFLTLLILFWTSLAQLSAPGPVVTFGDETLQLVTDDLQFSYHEAPIPHYIGAHEKQPGRTVALASAPTSRDIRGYAGPINLLLAIDEHANLTGVQYIDSNETPAYIFGIQAWLDQLSGRNLQNRPLKIEEIDALSGATLSSKAALATINRTAQAGFQAAFNHNLSIDQNDSWSAFKTAVFTYKFILTGILLVLFFPVYYRAHDHLRLVYQGLVLIVFGLMFNCLLTEVDFVNLSLGHLPSLLANPYWYLLIGFVVITGILYGQVYCGYVCPFGALQEFISRFGRLLSLRTYINATLENHIRYLKYIILCFGLIACWLNSDVVWISFNPMQHVFHLPWLDWIGWLTAVSLIGSLFYYRFWCRYFCPLGALLSLFNKVRLLQSFAPKRQLKRCDLGVRHEFDIDCIQCHRCITGADIGKHSR